MQKSMPSLRDWFETPLGGYLLAREQALVDQMVSDVFGFNAMQLGLAQFDFLRMSRIPLRFAADDQAQAKLRTDARHLPLCGQCLDLLILPHVLEFSRHPHQILREAERVLMPEGHVVIAGFNPWSLWGLWRVLRRTEREFPWCGRFISLPRLKDWLALLGFEITAGRMCCYVPPVNGENWLQRFRFTEHAGDRWCAMAGGVYLVQAKKRVAGMRLLTPSWNEKIAREKALAAAAQKVGNLGPYRAK